MDKKEDSGKERRIVGQERRMVDKKGGWWTRKENGRLDRGMVERTVILEKKEFAI